jgi:hypothetical protein
MPKRGVLAFGKQVRGSSHSTICNNLIADLLFLRKCHAPAQSLLRLGPRSQVLGLCPGLSQEVQARERGRVPCSHRRIWSLAVLHGIPGRRRYSGGEWVHLCGGLVFRRDQFILEGNAIAFLIYPEPHLGAFLAF